MSDITMMKYAHSIWDWAVGQLPRKPVNEDKFVTDAKLAITIRHDVGRPEPAGIRFFDFAPKAFHGIIIAGVLAGCGSGPAVLTDPTIVYQDKLVRVQTPGSLLVACQVTPLPQKSSSWSWFEIFELMKDKDAEQNTCNERFGIIEEWQNERVVEQ